MNALRNIRRFPPANAWFSGIVFVSVCALAGADTRDDAKTHALFMGSNIMIRYKNTLYPVQDLNGSSWVIEVNGERREIPTRSDRLEIKAVPAMKLTQVSATINHLVAARDYTTDNDPTVRLTRDIASAEALNFSYQVLNNQVAALTEAPTSQIASQNIRTPGMFSESDLHELEGGTAISGIATNSQKVAASDAAIANEKSAIENYTQDSAGNDQEMYGRRGLSLGYDAMRVSFDLNTDHVIKRPYIVTYTMFREKGTKPGMVRNLIYGINLHQIDPRPQTIEVLEGGFPPNFEIVSFQLHLYEGRKEIATNVSSKRVDLTRDEAFEYLKLDYLAAHKGETLSASPLMGSLPGTFPEIAKSGRYAGDFFVRVSKDGVPEGIFRDSSARTAIDDPALEQIVNKIRFQPALNKGDPVEGLASVNLNRLDL